MSEQPRRTQDAMRQAIEKLESFSYKDMKQWLVSRLNGRDVLLPDTGEESLAYPVAAIYPLLSRGAREDLLRATTALLHDLAEGRDWTGQPAEELLLLIQYLAPHDAKDILSSLAVSDRFRNLGQDVQYRVLQGLISLQVSMRPPFWRGIFRKDPVVFAGLAFDGLATKSVEHAIGLLPCLPNDESVAELIANALPGFVDRAGKKSLPKIGQLLSDRLAELKPLIRAEIKQFCRDEGLSLEDAVMSKALVDKLSWEEAGKALFTLPKPDLELVGACEDAAL